jgi:hypothetical protein
MDLTAISKALASENTISGHLHDPESTTSGGTLFGLSPISSPTSVLQDSLARQNSVFTLYC